MSRTALGARSGYARRVIALVTLAALVAGWWTWLRPSFIADGPVQLINVHGVSMQPGLHTGDVAIVYRRSSYGPGDVVAYRSGRVPSSGRPGAGPLVIHRITGGNGVDGFVLRGDNTTSDDPWRPTREDVVGEMLFSVPNLAGVVGWLSQPFHAGGLFAGIFVALVLGAEPRRRDGSGADSATRAPDTHELVS